MVVACGQSDKPEKKVGHLHKEILPWGTSLVVQWLRIHFPMQGTQVRSLVRELRSYMPWGSKACKPQRLSPLPSSREPTHHKLQTTDQTINANYRAHVLWSPRITAEEPVHGNKSPAGCDQRSRATKKDPMQQIKNKTSQQKQVN